jgi:hypothetical protein
MNWWKDPRIQPYFIFVVGIWFGCFFIVVLLGCFDGYITTLGQIGDTFGTINSLFTGLGIIGVIYTLRLQQIQLEEQRKESSRNAREQLLAARLNACVASLEVLLAKRELDKRYAPLENDILRFESCVFEVESAGIEIAMLSYEASMGFDAADWDVSRYRHAIRAYLTGRLSYQFKSIEKALGDNNVLSAHREASVVSALLIRLARIYIFREPDLGAAFSRMSADLDKFGKTPALVAKWCKDWPTTYPEDQKPWV